MSEYVEETDKQQGGDKRRLAVLWRLVPLISPHKGRFFLALVTLFAASGITLIYPWAAREAVRIMAARAPGRTTRASGNALPPDAPPDAPSNRFTQ